MCSFWHSSVLCFETLAMFLVVYWQLFWPPEKLFQCKVQLCSYAARELWGAGPSRLGGRLDSIKVVPKNSFTSRVLNLGKRCKVKVVDCRFFMFMVGSLRPTLSRISQHYTFFAPGVAATTASICNPTLQVIPGGRPKAAQSKSAVSAIDASALP